MNIRECSVNVATLTAIIKNSAFKKQVNSQNERIFSYRDIYPKFARVKCIIFLRMLFLYSTMAGECQMLKDGLLDYTYYVLKNYKSVEALALDEFLKIFSMVLLHIEIGSYERSDISELSCSLCVFNHVHLKITNLEFLSRFLVPQPSNRK